MKILQRLLEIQELEMGPKAESPEARRTVASLRGEIPEQILAHYDRLRARGKRGVALVRHGVCTGCQMRLASGPYATLVRGDDVAICDSCGRYLVLAPEPPPTAPAEAAAREKPMTRKRRRKATADAVA